MILLRILILMIYYNSNSVFGIRLVTEAYETPDIPSVDFIYT